jgi:hypothetical protein
MALIGLSVSRRDALESHLGFDMADRIVKHTYSRCQYCQAIRFQEKNCWRPSLMNDARLPAVRSFKESLCLPRRSQDAWHRNGMPLETPRQPDSSPQILEQPESQ